MLKTPRVIDKKHRMFIASLPCLHCGISGHTQAAHVRSGNGAGASYKSGDDCTVPLCATWPDRPGCHDIQGKSEKEFWKKYGGVEEATKLAKELYMFTGNEGNALIALMRFRRNACTS